MPELTRRNFLKLAAIAGAGTVLRNMGVRLNQHLEAEKKNEQLILNLLAATQLTPTTDRELLAKLEYDAQFVNPGEGANRNFGTWHGPRGPINIKTNEMGELPMPPDYTLKYPDFLLPNPVQRYTTEGEHVIVHTYWSLGTDNRVDRPALINSLDIVFGGIPTLTPPELYLNFISKKRSTESIYRTTNPLVYAPGIAQVNQRFQENGPDFAASSLVTQKNQAESLTGYQIFINFDVLHDYALETGLTYEQACWLAIANEISNVWGCTPNPSEAARLGRQKGSEGMSTAMGWLAALAPDYRSAIFGQVDIKTVQIGVNLLAEEMAILAKLN